MHQVHSQLSLHAQVHLGACACRVVVPPAPCRSRAPRPCRRLGGRFVACKRTSLRRVVAWLAVSWPCVATQASSLKLLPCHNTLQCIATQNSSPGLLFQSRYTQCIVTQFLKPTSGHNTLLCIAIQSFPTCTPKLQYNFPIAIHFPSLTAAFVTIQLLYCNTNPQPF